MSKVETDANPLVVHVQTVERAGEIVELCDRRGLQVIVGVEPDKPENLSGLNRLLEPHPPSQPKPDTPKRSVPVCQRLEVQEVLRKVGWPLRIRSVRLPCGAA